MNRRDFMQSLGAVSATLTLPNTGRLLAEGAPDHWRTFEVKTRVEVLKSSGETRVWLPAALSSKTLSRRQSRMCLAPRAARQGSSRAELTGSESLPRNFQRARSRSSRLPAG